MTGPTRSASMSCRSDLSQSRIREDPVSLHQTFSQHRRHWQGRRPCDPARDRQSLDPLLGAAVPPLDVVAISAGIYGSIRPVRSNRGCATGETAMTR
jgi:hypothetical protein